jgi:methyl-accepting chemotaxis protein
MRQFTIAEQVTAAVLLPVAVALAVPWLSAVLSPLIGESYGVYTQIVTGLAAAGIAGGVVIAITRSITRALSEATDTIDAIASAELESAPTLPPSRSEIARLAGVTDRLANIIGERHRRELVHNDLDRAWQASRRVKLSNLVHDVEITTEGGIQPIIDGAATLQLRADDMLVALDSARAAFDETARAVEGSRTMNEAAGELSGHTIRAIAEISDHVRHGSGLGREAVARANASNTTIDALAKAANQIGDIVSVINQISEQTNLLALNATIEAARAGEAGRGFSVVASEVKTLATQTGKSTEQIGAKVAEIQSTTREVVASLAGVAETIDQFSGVTASVSAAIEQQRAATEHFVVSARETSAAVSKIVNRMNDIADMVQRSSEAAQDVSTVAASMQSTSQALCRGIPDIVRRAVKADLREFPRYEVKLTARLEHNGRVVDVTVRDVSEGGMCIDASAKLPVGEQIAATFPGMKTIIGEVVRYGGDSYGVCITPVRLRLEELRDLVTAPEPERAA